VQVAADVAPRRLASRIPRNIVVITGVSCGYRKEIFVDKKLKKIR